MTELKNKMVRYGWTLVSENASQVRMTRENYIEHMGDVYATQDTIALAQQLLGKDKVKVVRFRHYTQERIELTLTI